MEELLAKKGLNTSLIYTQMLYPARSGCVALRILCSSLNW